MDNSNVDDIIRHIVLAHSDGDMQCIALIYLDKEGQPEIHYAVNNIQAYAINFGLDCIKAGLLSDVLNHASKPSKDRE